MKHIDYYFATMSPWAYLGHERFKKIAAKHGASVRVMPVDLGKIFPLSGGLPLGKRAPQRQAYRLQELARFRDFLNIPLNVNPRFFPVAGDASAKLIITAREKFGVEAAMDLSGRVLRACWAEERNIADEQTLKDILSEANLDAGLWQASLEPSIQAAYEADTERAMTASVFGSPTYVVNGEVFWGQDRLELLDWRLGQLA
jgi:carboxymethylenebutenolidase